MVELKWNSNLLPLAWGLRLDPIVIWNAHKPTPVYASLGIAFHPKGALSARKCIAEYRLKFQNIHCQFFFLDPPMAFKNIPQGRRNDIESEGPAEKWGANSLNCVKYCLILKKFDTFVWKVWGGGAPIGSPIPAPLYIHVFYSYIVENNVHCITVYMELS